MAQTVQQTQTPATPATSSPDIAPGQPARRGFSLSTEEIQADVRRAPRAYVRALKVETDGE